MKRPEDDAICLCGHRYDSHEPSGPCMKVDLNAGGRFVHRFCGCQRFRPAPETERKETDDA